MIASGLVGAAIALPWLILLPLGGATEVIAAAFTLVAAFHGAGLVVARLARAGGVDDARVVSPWLLIQWGTATIIGLSGVAIALGAGTLVTHAVLVFGFAAVHTVALGLRFARDTARIADSLAGPRTWLIPAALLAGLGAIAMLGAAGEPLARPFDDDGHVAAQLRRVLDTGALGDWIGYPRTWQLGAQVSLAAIASAAGEGFARVVEPLALVLALGLAASRIGAREPSSALWATLLIAAGFGLPLAPSAPLACWTAVGLAVALYTMLSAREPAPALPLAITAGALLALRYELAPIAVAAAIAAWWRQRGDHLRTATLIGGMFAVGFPFLVARMLASRSVPPLAQTALAAPALPAVALRILLAAAIAIPAAWALRMILPDDPSPHGEGHRRSFRVAATATAVALGALVARLTGDGPYSMQVAWPIAIAFAITLVIALARSERSSPHARDGDTSPGFELDRGRSHWLGLSPAALIAALLMCLVIFEGRRSSGALRWSRRMVAAAAGIEAAQRPPGEGSDPYAPLLAGVPVGATVAVWVSEPEHLDYARHRFIDLRTPAGASDAAPLLAQLPAEFLLLEADNARRRRTQGGLLHRVVCRTAWQICADGLEAIALRHPTIARRDQLRIVDLRR